MKKLDKVPQEVLNLIQTEHEKAMTLLSGQSPILTLPTRQVKMRIDRPDRGYQMEDVIIPETLVYYQGDLFADGEYCNTVNIIYHLSLTKKPFPFGHIYMSSGSVCLGGIFVPSRISIYNLSQPLEALFLKNDHNTGHGGGNANITGSELEDILEIMSRNDIKISEDSRDTLRINTNLIANDAIWILSADVRKQTSLEQSIYIMEKVFKIIFTEKLKEDNNGF